MAVNYLAGNYVIKLNQENRVIFLHLQSSTEKCPYKLKIVTIKKADGINYSVCTDNRL